MIGRVVRFAVAVLGVAAAGLAVPGPAQAATCSTGSGVSVVVDYHQLGGGAQSACDAGGAGETADAQFADADFDLSYVSGEPFVCQVDEKPDRTCPRTPPADAYWSLWWSDGKSGKWVYASSGVTSLKVPDGGYVALSWQGQSSQAKPRVTPTAHTTAGPSSGPSSAPSSAHPSHGPTQGPSSDGPGAASSGPTTGSTTRSTTGSTTGPSHDRTKSRQGHGKGKAHRHHAGKTPDASPEASATGRAQGPLTGVATGRADGPGGSGGLPAWVAPLAIVVIFAGAGGFVVVRRKTRGA